MFNIFHPDSTGSLFHWSKIFLSLLQRLPSQIQIIMTSKPYLFQRMLPYVHESPVSEALVHFVAYPQYLKVCIPM